MTKNIFIVGPTGSGKSALALAVAQALNGVIVNVDSCQVYDGVPILTAQPSADDQATSPHFLYGFHPVSEDYNVSAHVDRVRMCVQELPSDVPRIFVGGTGLYVKALTQGLQSQSVDPEVRMQARTLYEQEGIQPLYDTLKQHQPGFSLHLNDHQRIVRAYELFLSDDTAAETSEPLCSTAFILHVTPDAEVLRQHLRPRIEAMVAEGALEEVESVFKTGEPLGNTAGKIIGLTELQAFLEGRMAKKEALDKMFYRTCQYAKRQRTWFRHQLTADLVVSELMTPEGVSRVQRLCVNGVKPL